MLQVYLRTAPQEHADAVNLISDQIIDIIGDIVQGYFRRAEEIESSAPPDLGH
jgi:hypothetical protein